MSHKSDTIVVRNAELIIIIIIIYGLRTALCQCSKLRVRQTDPTVCQPTEVLKTLLDPTRWTAVWLGTDL
jgi:hypothetical protein